MRLMHENSFIHLHVHTAYSLAEGAIPVKKLVGLSRDLNMPAVAMTDTGNVFGAMEFSLTSISAGIQPIIGCQVALGLEGHQLVLLVQDETGYKNLCKLISKSFLDVEPHIKPHTTFEQLEAHAAGLICLTGGVRGPVAQYLLHKQKKEAEACLKKLNKIFADHLYVEIQRHHLSQENQVEEALIDLAYKHNLPLVATNDCYFPKRSMAGAHDALLCIAEGRYISEDDRRKETQEHYFKSAKEMRELFADIPEAADNTINIAKRCHYLLKPIDPLLPAFDTGEGRNEDEELRKQATDGLNWRLENFVYTDDMDEAAKKETAKPYFERLEFELGTIIQMGFPGYFLICSDFIKWAKDHNIPVGPGRGSGAGSVVAWALKITDLDPLEFGLLFERFLNPERVSMPDFDVDFCQTRRDEVIRYVQDKYGYDSVAQIITFGKLQARAVVRDVGRVLQLSYGQVDRIAKMIPANPANPVSLAEALEQEPDLQSERLKDESTDNLITIALQLEGLYRHASTHAAGVVIGDRPLQELLALYRDPRSDMPVTQFNMKYVEQTGLVKFDFLGLKTMTVVQKAVEFIKKSVGTDIDYLQIPFDDQKTYEMLTEGKTVGVFQLESSGMRDVMRKLKPNRLEDIIALVALYRPGPMDNIPAYIDVKEGKQAADYMHPKLQPLLEETYGIMIYQEQVMQAAQVLAGYTLGGADLLRRAMGKKIKEEMDKQREMFVNGCAEHNDIPAEKANEIFDRIAKFAGYGFNKSHAAAYAVIAYWTGWLKANYPVEFMAASMSLDMGNTDKLSVFKQDLDKIGITLLPPDINKSGVEFLVEGDAVRYSLAALKGVGEGAMEALIAERTENGPFKDIADLTARLEGKGLNRRQFEQLASAGAFECLEPNRAKMQGAAETILRQAQTMAEEKASGQSNLFGGDDGGVGLDMPPIPDVPEWDPLEKLRREFDAVGFYLSAHPLDTRAEQLERLKILSLAQVEERMTHKSSDLVDMAGILIRKQIKFSAKSGKKYAFLQLSDSSGVYEVTAFSEVLDRCKDILEVGEPLLLKISVEQQEEQLRMTIMNIQPMEQALAGRLQRVIITLDSPDPVPQIKTLLETEGYGPCEIQINVLINDDKQAEITLQGKWSFSPQAQRALGGAQGVSSIQAL